MEIKLHANATTTPRIRKYLQESDKSDRELADELGISVTTVRRWRSRDRITDRHTTPGVIHKALIPEQVSMINTLRDMLCAPLDELLFIVAEGLGISVSRATLSRYLRPALAQRKSSPLQGKKALKSGVMPTTLERHHRVLSLGIDDGGEHHLLWAREPVSGWCYGRVYSGISPALEASWLNDVMAQVPADIRHVETGVESCAIRVEIPLAELVPALRHVTPDELIRKLCQLWNSGKVQRKLGDTTPQGFLEALRHKD
mgnify:FL=1